MKLIGKGLFTKCYLNDDQKTVTLHSICHVKECMAWGWFPESYLFCDPVRGDDVNKVWHGYDVHSYTMPYFHRYPSLKKALEPEQWELYTALKALCIERTEKLYSFDLWHKAFDTLPDRFAEEREALKGALDAMSNYGIDVEFEISPRNVRANAGKLLLLDCFFMRNQRYACTLKARR